MTISTRRIGALIASGAIAIAAMNGAASGSTLGQTKHRRVQLARRISSVRERANASERTLRRRITMITRMLGERPTGRMLITPQQWHAQRRQLVQRRTFAHHRLRHAIRHTRQRLAALGGRRRQVRSWITRYGVLHACPVRGPHVVADNFGVLVRMPGVPVHVHEGNDITAAMWTPIVAPFAGRAVAAPNSMGGLAVEVYGASGFVYNAHLVAYGQLGQVGTGTVIGYVGATGDASGPHDHFEWHPNDGPAVDPNPFLNAVC